MSRFFLHDASVVREVDIEGFRAARARSTFSWVHIDGTQDNVDALMAEFADIDHAALAAFKASETRPRCAQFGKGALVNMRGLGDPSIIDGDPLVSIRLWAQQGLVVSLSYRALGVLDAAMVQMSEGKLHDPGDLISWLAIVIAEALDPEIAELGDRLDAIESRVVDEEQTTDRYKVAQLRAAAISYRRFLAPQRQAMERLMTMQAEWLEPDDRTHLQEAADRCARMVEELEAVRERAALTHEALTDLRAEHMNRQALVLAIVALIFLPLTFVTGLLGMNVEGIPFAREAWAFWGVVLFCLAVGAAMGVWFRVTHWLQK